MLTNKNDFQEAINAFNKKHGCKLDLDSFEASVAKYKDEYPNMAYTLAYKDTFASIYRQSAINSVINNKIISGKEMLDEFESSIMKPYREACKANKIDIDLKPYAGMSALGRGEFLKNRINEVPNNKLSASRELYNNGGITYDDMMEYTRKVSEGGEIDRTKAATIAAFVNVLEETNKNRSIFWRIRHPIMNYYEKENARLMKQTLNSNKCKYNFMEATEFSKEETSDMQNDRVATYTLVMDEKDAERKKRYEDYEKEKIRIYELAAEAKRKELSVEIPDAPTKEPMQRSQ